MADGCPYECLLYALPVHWGVDAPGSFLESSSNCFWKCPQMLSFLLGMMFHFLISLKLICPSRSLLDTPCSLWCSLPLQSSLFLAAECTQEGLGG